MGNLGLLSHLDRAGALLSAMMSVSALAIIPLSHSAVHASVTLDLYNTTAAGSNLGPPFPASDVSLNSSAISDGVQIFGSFSTTGAEYQSITSANILPMCVVTFNGDGNGQAAPGSVLNIGYDFSFNFTGGQVVSLGLGGDNVLGQNVVEGSFPIDVISGQTISGDVQSLSVADPPFLYGGFWEAEISFIWQNYSPTDTLTLTVPENSFDVTLSPVPEPAAASILMLPIMGLLRRRSG
jgi:hypothetical protein